MHKIVFNNCYGGFSLSLEAVDWLEKNANDSALIDAIKDEKQSTPKMYLGHVICRYLPRHHKDLIAVVEALGSAANGNCADLAIAHIPGRQYRIEEYDGAEDVRTPEDSDWILIEGD